MGHTEPMGEFVQVVFTVVVVASLVAIIAYVMVFFVMVVLTLGQRPVHDPVAQDLDRILEEILGPRDRVSSAVRARH